jgi:omega-6 fatty acid desaturase (delta-12 desaturase)
MYVGVDHRFWPALALTPLAACTLVRIFIIQHDCGHGSFFASRTANDWTGLLCSLLTLTHYGHWRRQHSCHHANWNNLDRRESGVDIYSKCLTVAEYCDLSPLGRYAHRLSRHPVVLFVLLPPVVLLAIYRLPFDTPPSWRKERRSVHATNLAMVASAVVLGLLLGFPEVAIVQLSVIALAACIGAWLFFVQHQFEHTSWLRADEWGSMTASLRGSSHLLLPGVLRWFTGNIGLHHLHHLNPRIPNYRLTQYHAENASPSDGVSLGSRDAWRATLMRLWDEAAARWCVSAMSEKRRGRLRGSYQQRSANQVNPGSTDMANSKTVRDEGPRRKADEGAR